MKYKVYIYNCVILVILITFASLFTPFILNRIEDSEQKVVDLSFNTFIDSIINGIESNLTNLHNELLLNGVSMRHAFTTNLSEYVPNINKEKEIIYQTMGSSSFVIFGITFHKIITNNEEREEHLHRSQMIYNNPSMIVYDIKPNNTFAQTPNNTLPLVLLTITAQESAPIGVPSIGLANTYSFSRSELVNGFIELEDEDYTLTEVLKIDRPDGQVFTTIGIGIRYRDWLIIANFNPTQFLQKIVLPIQENNILMIVYDNITGQFYKNTNENSRYSLEGEPIIKNLNFKTVQWRIKFQKTTNFVKEGTTDFKSSLLAMFISFYIMIILFVILLNFIYIYLTKNTILISKKEYSNQLKISKNSINYILHEIRNLLTAPTALLTIKNHAYELEKDEYESVKRGVLNAVKISTNILDFDQLIIKKYKLMKESIIVPQELLTIVKNLPFKTIISSKMNYKKVLLDKDKFTEMIYNGLQFTNSIIPINDLNIRIQTIEDYLLIELVVSVKSDQITIDLDLNSLFIPFFLKEDEELIKIFEPDKKILEKCKQYFGKTVLENMIINSNNSMYSEQKIYNDDTKLSLPLARLIAKNMDGDIGVEYKSDIFRYWAFIKFEPGLEVEVEVEKEPQRLFELRLP